jgi:hypothetical protein
MATTTTTVTKTAIAKTATTKTVKKTTAGPRISKHTGLAAPGQSSYSVSCRAALRLALACGERSREVRGAAGSPSLAVSLVQEAVQLAKRAQRRADGKELNT